MQSFLLQIDVTEIVVHKADQPNTVVDLFDTHGLTRERSAEIYFLFENADPPAVGNQSRPIVERIGEFSDAAVRAYGGLVDVLARSVSPSSPHSLYRSKTLYPVTREIPNSRHNEAMLSPSLSRNTKCMRSSTMDRSFHGIGTSKLD